jgi:sec-independent protein translocase protein TatA
MVEQDFQASMKEAEEEITAAGKQSEEAPQSLSKSGHL